MPWRGKADKKQPEHWQPSSHVRNVERVCHHIFCSVFRIRDILDWSGSSDNYLWLTEPDPTAYPDPALFGSDLQDANKKQLFFLILQRLKVMKKLQNRRVFYFACRLKDPDPWIRIQEAQKHTDPEHCFCSWCLVIVLRREYFCRIFFVSLTLVLHTNWQFYFYKNLKKHFICAES